MLKLSDDGSDTTTSNINSLVKSEPHQNGHNQYSDDNEDDDDNEDGNEDDDDDDDEDTKFKLATPFKQDYEDNGEEVESSNDTKNSIEKRKNPKSRHSISSSSDEMATTVLLPPLEMSLDEQRVLGYMPLRDDFEREYKNDAETLLSNLAIANQQLIYLNNNSLASVVAASSGGGDEADAIDFYLKLSLIKMYRECLCERARFKKIARDYGLINNATALINSHARVMSNHTMYYNSSLVYFNHKTANSFYNSFNFILNNGNDVSSNNAASTVTASLVASGSNNSHYLNGSNSLTNGNHLDESMTSNININNNNNNGNGNNTFNINSLLANGDLLDGKRRGKRSENDKEMM